MHVKCFLFYLFNHYPNQFKFIQTNTYIFILNFKPLVIWFNNQAKKNFRKFNFKVNLRFICSSFN